MKVLSLFSGGGLGDYGLELVGMEIVGQVEIDGYCQKILKLRWPEVPKWKDVNVFSGKNFVRRFGKVDCISGGFPCQDISIANTKGKGLSGNYSGLWWQMFRIIREIRPSYCLIENVRQLLHRGMGDVIGSLASTGYDCEWSVLRASDFEAPHRRDRLFIVAYSQDKSRLQAGQSVMSSRDIEQTWTGDLQLHRKAMAAPDWKISETYFDGTHDETSGRVDRCKIVGNGQDVSVVQWIGERIMEFEANNPN